MGSVAVHSDIELFLTGWFRARIAASDDEAVKGFVVDNKEPEPTADFPDRLLVIRDDGMTRTSNITGETSVGLSILAGTKRTPFEAKRAALLFLAWCDEIPSPDPANPVSAFLASNGPFGVTEAQERARQYVAVTFAVVGTPL